MLIARFASAVAALGFAAIPVIFPEGWGPLVALLPAAGLFGFAVFGTD